jgi:hypothetical protein
MILALLLFPVALVLGAVLLEAVIAAIWPED